MILQNLEIYKVLTTKQAITSFAGLPLLLGMARSLGLEEQLNALPLKERQRGCSPAEYSRRQYARGILETVYMEDGVSVGPDSTGDGDESYSSLQDESSDVGRGRIFS